jgi:hypothetical protein
MRYIILAFVACFGLSLAHADPDPLQLIDQVNRVRTNIDSAQTSLDSARRALDVSVSEMQNLSIAVSSSAGYQDNQELKELVAGLTNSIIQSRDLLQSTLRLGVQQSQLGLLVGKLDPATGLSFESSARSWATSLNYKSFYASVTLIFTPASSIQRGGLEDGYCVYLSGTGNLKMRCSRAMNGRGYTFKIDENRSEVSPRDPLYNFQVEGSRFELMTSSGLKFRTPPITGTR